MIAALMAVAMSVATGTCNTYAGTGSGSVAGCIFTGSTRIGKRTASCATDSGSGVTVSVSDTRSYRIIKNNHIKSTKGGSSSKTGHTYSSYQCDSSKEYVSIYATHMAIKNTNREKIFTHASR